MIPSGYPAEGQELYRIEFIHRGGAQRTPGLTCVRWHALHVPVSWNLRLGYARYEFSGCDMSAMDAELRALLGMVGTF